jgi:hypothetical protein
MEPLQPMDRSTGLSVRFQLYQGRKEFILTRNVSSQVLHDALAISMSSQLPPKCSLTPCAVEMHLQAVLFYQVSTKPFTRRCQRPQPLIRH